MTDREKSSPNGDDSEEHQPAFDFETDQLKRISPLIHSKQGHQRQKSIFSSAGVGVSPTTPRSAKRKAQIFGSMRDTFYDAQTSPKVEEQDPFTSTIGHDVPRWQPDLQQIHETPDDAEMVSNAEAADMYLTLPKGHSFTPGSSPDKGSAPMTKVPRHGCALDNIASNHQFSNKLLTQEAEFEEAGGAHPHVKWDHGLPEGTVRRDTHIVQSSDDGTEGQSIYPVHFEDASSDESYDKISQVSLDEYGSNGSPPPRKTTTRSERLRAPTPYPLSHYLANASTHVNDLLYRSPTLPQRAHAASLQSCDIESLNAVDRFEYSKQNVVASGDYPQVRFPEVSTSILKSLPGEAQEGYLDTAIEHAKFNSANLRIPFMILHDGRSSMLKVDEGRVTFWDKPEDWKKAQLAAVHVGPDMLMHSAPVDEKKATTNKIGYRERLQKILHLPVAHPTFTPQDLPPIPAIPGNAAYSHSLEKAHSILGITTPQALSSPSIQDDSPRKRSNSVAPSPTQATQKPLPTTPTRHSIAMTDCTIIEHAKKRDSDMSDVTIKPFYGQPSPSKEASQTPRYKAKSGNPNLPREAENDGKTSETSSLSGDDISAGFTTPLKGNEISRPFTKLDGTTQTSKNDDSKSDEGSVTSSNYLGDESSVKKCQPIKMVDQSSISSHSNPFEGFALKVGEEGKKEKARPSPSVQHSNPFEGLGLMGSMLAHKEAKEAADHAAELQIPPSPERTGDSSGDSSASSSPGTKPTSRRQRLQHALPPLDKMLHQSSESSSKHSPSEVTPPSSSSTNSPFNVFSPAMSPDDLQRKEEHAEKIKAMGMSALTMSAPTDEERDFARALTERNKARKAKKERDARR